MDGENPWLNLEQAQSDIIVLLKNIKQMMMGVIEVFNFDDSGVKYQHYYQEFTELVEKAENLELRLAILAPMKAGKSTIVNVVVAQELLPSRNAAMTTLPTEIIFNKQLSEPILTLKEQTIAILQKAMEQLRSEIEIFGYMKIKDKIAAFPHLLNLLSEIQQPGKLIFQAQTTGREAIVKCLMLINDLVRLYTILSPPEDVFKHLIDIPSIETSFWHGQGSQQSDKLGNLVIVDTPGPNEAGQNLKLTAVVQEQLRKSSMVLIVLDFTQLNSKAAEDIKKILEPVIQLLGKENLYVLINKIDQRRKGDMTSTEVKDFVFADLGLNKVADQDRVFEVSAIRAFSATKFMMELQQRPLVAIEDLETVESLAQEALGARWESKLQRSTIEDLQEEANFLWEDSGFKPFLEQAIAALMENAAPKCLFTVLKLARKRLLAVSDDLRLRYQAIAQDEERLKQEVEALEADLKSLETCRNRLRQVDRIRIGLQQTLTQILEVFKKEATVSINDYFIGEKYERSDLLQKADIKMREIFLKNLTSFEIFPEWISKNIKSTVEYKTDGVFEFRSQHEAEECAKQAILWAEQRSEKLLKKFRKETDKEIEKARVLLTAFLKKETEPIIERAKNRLEQAFNIQLVLAPPILDSASACNEVKTLIKSQTRYVDQGYEEKIIKKRAWYHWLWLISFDDTEKFKKPDLQEEYYLVVLEDIVTHINRIIDNSVNQLNEEINNYIEQDFQDHVNMYFGGLDKYMRDYRSSLKQAQQDQQLSLGEKKKLVKMLNSLVPQVHSLLKQVYLAAEKLEKLKQS